jgi:two-component system, NarL family, response regulator NreC
MPRIRVVVADDHALVRAGIHALLAACPDIEVVAEAADGHEAIEATRRLQPDVLLLDVGMPGLGGLEAALAVAKDCPRTRILVLTQYSDREYVSRFLKAGACGYLLKKMAGTELPSAIRAVHRGGLVLDPEVARTAVSPAPSASDASASPYESLTDREKQVLKLVAEGRSNKEVAELLAVSVRTAMTHREHLMHKLDLHNRSDLVRFAVRQGVIRA